MEQGYDEEDEVRVYELKRMYNSRLFLSINYDLNKKNQEIY